MAIRTGTAGWSIPRASADAFPPAGSHLERYAGRFVAVEINSSFHRPHRKTTYQRWADSTPNDFAFSVKVPKSITHEKLLRDCHHELATFLDEVTGLGTKLRVLLVQLPPRLAWDERVAQDFFANLRDSRRARVVCEPRHASWFASEPTQQLANLGIGRVAADPSPFPAAAAPGGDPATTYFRWHGSPTIYRSSYDPPALAALAERLLASAKRSDDVWCIFDNTALGAATANALELQRLLSIASA
jgi:uncharacterized protein YecE (DUF72 family)